MSKQNSLCIQRSQPGGPRKSGEAPSLAQMEEMYASFNAWKEKFQDSIVDLGGKLGDGKVVTSDGATDRPVVDCSTIHAKNGYTESRTNGQVEQ